MILKEIVNQFYLKKEIFNKLVSEKKDKIIELSERIILVT